MTVEETGILLWNPLGGEAGKMDMSLPDDRSKMAVEPSSCSTTRNISQSSQRISMNEDNIRMISRKENEKVGRWQEHGPCSLCVTTLDNNSTRETQNIRRNRIVFCEFFFLWREKKKKEEEEASKGGER